MCNSEVYVAVMQNKGKEMYKCVLNVQSCFFLTRVSTDFFFALLVAVAVSMFLLLLFWIKFKYSNESFAFSPG